MRQPENFQRFKHYVQKSDPKATQENILGRITVKFTCHENTKRKDGTAPVYLQARVSGKRVKVNTGIRIEPSEWSESKQLIKGKSKKVDDWNRVLEGLRSKANAIDLEYRLRNAAMTAETFTEEMTDVSSRIDFVRSMKHKWRNG